MAPSTQRPDGQATDRPGAPDWFDVWPVGDNAVAELVNVSENHTFRLTAPLGTFFVRVHRPGYQSRPSIESELAWLLDLSGLEGLSIPEPVPGRNGALIQSVTIPGDTAPRLAVMFGALPGAEPLLDAALPGHFHTIGTMAARMHTRVATWMRPEGFTRPVWNTDSVLLPDGPWGDWRAAPLVTPAISHEISAAAYLLRQKLAAYGTAPDRFGLIHGDMRLGNLLTDGTNLHLLDFDDCGFGWFAYDFAAAISFHEHHELVPALRANWLTGYRGLRPFAAEHEAMLDSMILLRRIALLAWIGSHQDAPYPRQLAPHFAVGTARLASLYRSGQRLS